MSRDSIDDLEVLFAVVREGSFTQAAAKLGVSQSALSQTVRNIEAKLGVRLLNRTTRSIAPTPAGQRLIETVAPRVESIREELAALTALRDTPSGTIRITADEYSTEAIIWPAIERFLPQYPDVTVEVIVDYGLTDIVSERYDAGVRLGDIVEKDMIAVPISGDQRMLVVASPVYLAGRQIPDKPQDLIAHACINLRLPTRGGLYVWEFERKKREVKVRVEGQVICNSLGMMMQAVLGGLGFAYLPAGKVQPLIDAGRLRSVLEDWSPSYPGFHLYYPSRRQHSAAFTLLVDALRFRR